MYGRRCDCLNWCVTGFPGPALPGTFGALTINVVFLLCSSIGFITNQVI